MKNTACTCVQYMRWLCFLTVFSCFFIINEAISIPPGDGFAVLGGAPLLSNSLEVARMGMALDTNQNAAAHVQPNRGRLYTLTMAVHNVIVQKMSEWHIVAVARWTSFLDNNQYLYPIVRVVQKINAVVEKVCENKIFYYVILGLKILDFDIIFSAYDYIKGTIVPLFQSGGFFVEVAKYISDYVRNAIPAEKVGAILNVLGSSITRLTGAFQQRVAAFPDVSTGQLQLPLKTFTETYYTPQTTVEQYFLSKAECSHQTPVITNDDYDDYDDDFMSDIPSEVETDLQRRLTHSVGSIDAVLKLSKLNSKTMWSSLLLLSYWVDDNCVSFEVHSKLINQLRDIVQSVDCYEDHLNDSVDKGACLLNAQMQTTAKKYSAFIDKIVKEKGKTHSVDLSSVDFRSFFVPEATSSSISQATTFVQQMGGSWNFNEGCFPQTSFYSVAANAPYISKETHKMKTLYDYVPEKSVSNDIAITHSIFDSFDEKIIQKTLNKQMKNPHSLPSIINTIINDMKEISPQPIKFNAADVLLENHVEPCSYSPRKLDKIIPKKESTSSNFDELMNLIGSVSLNYIPTVLRKEIFEDKTTEQMFESVNLKVDKSVDSSSDRLHFTPQLKSLIYSKLSKVKFLSHDTPFEIVQETTNNIFKFGIFNFGSRVFAHNDSKVVKVSFIESSTSFISISPQDFFDYFTSFRSTILFAHKILCDYIGASSLEYFIFALSYDIGLIVKKFISPVTDIAIRYEL